MSRSQIGQLFEYVETPIRAIVRLLDFRERPAQGGLGNRRHWKFEVVDALRSKTVVPGEVFDVMDHSLGSSYCWHVTELSPFEASKYETTPQP